MKTKQFFIASSSELKIERMEIVDLMQDLEDELAEQEVNLKPVKWEYMDSSMRERDKEDEYLEELRKSEFCFVLFWRSLGEFTVKELDVAVEEKRAGRLPKIVYVFFKESTADISEELAAFKETYSKKYADIPLYKFKDILGLRKKITTIIHDHMDH